MNIRIYYSDGASEQLSNEPNWQCKIRVIANYKCLFKIIIMGIYHKPRREIDVTSFFFSVKDFYKARTYRRGDYKRSPYLAFSELAPMNRNPWKSSQCPQVGQLSSELITVSPVEYISRKISNPMYVMRGHKRLRKHHQVEPFVSTAFYGKVIKIKSIYVHISLHCVLEELKNKQRPPFLRVSALPAK